MILDVQFQNQVATFDATFKEHSQTTPSNFNETSQLLDSAIIENTQLFDSELDENTKYFSSEFGEVYEVNGSDTIVVDDRLSTTSTNPVQNKVVTAALNTKMDELQFATNLDIDKLFKR